MAVRDRVVETLVSTRIVAVIRLDAPHDVVQLTRSLADGESD